MKNFKLKTYLYLSIIMLSISWISSCNSTFEEHYYPKKKIDKNLIQVLESNPKFSDFVKMIDNLELRKTLGESALYTCLAPTNDHVQYFLQENGYNSIDDIPEKVARQYVNYHFISGIYYKYDIEKKYTDALLKLGVNPTRAIYYKTRGEAKIPAKSIRIYTPSLFENQSEDYVSLYEKKGSGFMIENIAVVNDESDIDASNGVIHVLESAMNILPRADEAIMGDEETSIFSKWLEMHETFTLGEIDESGWVDTTKYKSYSLRRNIADESLLSTLFVPTNEAIQEYFEPYMSDLDNTLDSIPKKLITEIINCGFLNDIWFKSDIARNNPEVNTTTYVQKNIDLASHISGSILASNCVIYKLDKMIEPTKLNSVEGGIYLKNDYYSQWNWMFSHTTLEEGLTDWQYYQHAPATVLVQPDEIWGSPSAADLGTKELEYRIKECRTGILNYNVLEDGGFQNRFYPTENGYILYEDNKLYDYTGKYVSIISPNPTWVRKNGGIFEIDGFLTPLEKTDVTRTVFNLIKNNPAYSTFKNACTTAGIESELNLTGFFTYTVFIPTNTAIQNAGIDIKKMNKEDLLDWVQHFIIPNRFIFSDGTYTGTINNKNGEALTIGGSWDSFYVKSPSGSIVKPVTANIQASNGVVHSIDQIF